MIPHCLVTAVSSLTLYQVVSAMNDDVRCSYKLVPTRSVQRPTPTRRAARARLNEC